MDVPSVQAVEYIGMFFSPTRYNRKLRSLGSTNVTLKGDAQLFRCSDLLGGQAGRLSETALDGSKSLVTRKKKAPLAAPVEFVSN